MRRALVAAVSLIAVSAIGCGVHETGPRRIVYAGDPGTPHMEAFRQLLGQHFDSVRTIPVQDLATANLSDADVLIVDGVPISRGDAPSVVKTPSGVTLDTLAKATILIGGMGGRISDSLDLKLGWKFG